MRKAKAIAANHYCLRIELEEISPPIWRRLWIDGGVTLLELHYAIQAAMG